MIIEFKVVGKNAFLLELGNKYIRFYSQYGRVVNNNGDLYEVTTPYEGGDVEDIKFVQNGDVLYLFHPRYQMHTLSRYGDLDWRLEVFETKNGPWGKINTTNNSLKCGAKTGTTTINALENTFNPTDVGRLIRLTATDVSEKHWQAEKEYAVGQVVRSDGKYYEDVFGTKSGNEKPVHTEGKVYDGGIEWKYIHSGYGTARIIEYINPKEVRVEILDYMPNAVVEGRTTYWELGLIHGGDEYPMCGTFFRGRLAILMNVKGVPQVCLSCSDDYDNFADKEFGEVLATNAVSVPVTSDRYNEARWLCSNAVLFIGTSSGEFYLDSSSAGEAFGPDNVKIQQISSIGSKAITPVKIGSHIIFVTDTGTSIRDIIYSFSTDSYDPIDLGIYGRHLISQGIVDMRYQEYPNKIIWFAMSDGRLVGMTFSSEQKVAAMHQHNLSGKVKKLAIMPSFEYNTEELWMVINRGDRDCIEYIDNGIPPVIPNDVNEEKYIKQKAVYLDGCVGGEFGDKKYADFNSTIQFIDFSTFSLGQVEILDSRGFQKVPDRLEDDPIVNIRLTYGDMILSGDYGYEYAVQWKQSVLDNPNVHLKVGSGQVGYNYIVYKDDEEYTTGIVGNDKEINFSLGVLPFGQMVSIKVVIRQTHPKYRYLDVSHLGDAEITIYADGHELKPQKAVDGKIQLDPIYKNVIAGVRVKSEYVPQTIIVPVNNGGGVGDVQRIDHVTLTLWNSMGGSVGDNGANDYPINYRTTTAEVGSSTELYTGNKTVPVAFNTSTIKEKGATVKITNDSCFPMQILAIAPKFGTSGNGL